MVGHGGGSASSYLADHTSPIPSHCASIVVTSTLRVNTVVHAQLVLFLLVISNYLMKQLLHVDLALFRCLCMVIEDHIG